MFSLGPPFSPTRAQVELAVDPIEVSLGLGFTDLCWSGLFELLVLNMNCFWFVLLIG